MFQLFKPNPNKFKSYRKEALERWLNDTRRIRVKTEDDCESAFECDWQNQFKPVDANSTIHFSIFCSIADWNTNITDYLDDKRFDKLNLLNTGDSEILYRYYSRILLTTSEIMTDFQDMLSILRHGQLIKNQQLRNEKSTSRILLDKYTSPGNTNNLFNYINKICKHKATNIHGCNHHLKIVFEDYNNNQNTRTIRINNIERYFPRDANQTPIEPEVIEMMSLKRILDTIIGGYKVVDEEFKSDIPRFETFSELYKGNI